MPLYFFCSLKSTFFLDKIHEYLNMASELGEGKGKGVSKDKFMC